MSNLKSTLLNITRNVSKTSGVLVKTTKLSVNLAQEQETLKNLYIETGKKVHEIYQYGGSLGKFFDEKYHEIEAVENKITNLKEEIAKIKGVKECPKCGKQVDRNAEFCPKCGLRLESAAPGEAPPPYDPPYAPPSGPPYAPPSGPFTAAPPPETFEAPPGIPGITAPSVPAAPADYVPPLPAEPAKPTITAAPVKTVKCRACGAENDTSTKFCLSCGRIL